MGFRQNRPTIDYTSTFVIKQIIESAMNIIQMCISIFVEYMLAFDSVYRNKIIEYIVLFKVQTKLIRLIELTQINITVRIKINIDYREEFKVESGTKEEDPL